MTIPVPLQKYSKWSQTHEPPLGLPPQKNTENIIDISIPFHYMRIKRINITIVNKAVLEITHE